MDKFRKERLVNRHFSGRDIWPSKYAPRSFWERDAAWRAKAGDRHIPASEAERDHGNCVQCGLHIEGLSRTRVCPHCSSDNMQNRRLQS